MQVSTFNGFMNENHLDVDMAFYTLEEAIDMVEFQESLNCEDSELPDSEEM